MNRHRIVTTALLSGLMSGSLNNAAANFSVVNSAGQRPQGSSATLKNRAFPVVDGFGHDIPLAFALRQIVPHGVLVACNPAIAQHTMVTWKGGVPWNTALLRAIAPVGLTASITPVMVKISLNPGPEK